MSSETLTVGSLFAGIGGFDLGFERAGLTVKWQVEIDPFCRRVLAKHWPHVQRYEDVRTIRGAELESVDVLCGGFPCQPHSVAGLRRGADDERDLWPQFRRLIREIGPRWVVAENVPGLLSNDAGRFFGGVLRDLAESGYDAEWDCLPASAFGAPHQRDRVWLVAYPGGEQHEGARDADERTAATGLHASAANTLADADRSRSQGRQLLPERAGQRTTRAGGLADAYIERLQVRIFGRGPRVSITVPSDGCDQAEVGGDGAGGHRWSVEPDVGRVAHGVPARVDRLRGLGNAIVPQIAEWIGLRLMAAQRST